VARWYCPQGHRTFSLLPDFLAARLPGLLSTIEGIVTKALFTKSMEAAANELREPDVTLPAALRWLRRRVRPVCAALDAMLARDAAFITSGPGLLGVLLDLRHNLPEEVLGELPPPLGILRTPRVAGTPATSQHDMGPDRESAASYSHVSNLARTACVPSSCSQPPSLPTPRWKIFFGCGVVTGA
jgi:hypothetical protein